MYKCTYLILPDFYRFMGLILHVESHVIDWILVFHAIIECYHLGEGSNAH